MRIPRRAPGAKCQELSDRLTGHAIAPPKSVPCEVGYWFKIAPRNWIVEMLHWFERRRQRQRELRQGVDADLVRANRKRWKLAGALLACFFLLTIVQDKFKFLGAWHHIVTGAEAITLIGGFALAFWARGESAFLDRPEPEEPPRLWKPK